MPMPADDTTGRDDGSPQVIVEFSPRPGMRQVSLSAPETVQRSADALRGAMHVIHTMTDDLQHSVAELAHRPDQLQIEFGVKFDTEIGAAQRAGQGPGPGDAERIPRVGSRRTERAGADASQR
jgi:hypothetical protein